VGREAWSAMFMIFGLVDGGFLMTINGAPAGSPPEASLAILTNASASPCGGRRCSLPVLRSCIPSRRVWALTDWVS